MHLETGAAEVIWGTKPWVIFQGDCLEVLDRIPSASVDAIVTDPPAGISFMGKDWDEDFGGYEAWSTWLALRMREAYRILKPGGHALVWALPRTSHWTGRALELAGFEVRDRIVHMFGSGFPKSVNVSKEIDRRAGKEREVIGRAPWKSNNGKNDVYGKFALAGEHLPITAPATREAATWEGWGTALKPAAEDWWLVRKPPAGTIAANLIERGTGALNIHACRVPHVSAADYEAHAAGVEAIRERGGVMPGFNASDLTKANEVQLAGRWPAHVVLSHGAGCRKVGTRKVKAAPPWNEHHTASLFTGTDTSSVRHAEPDGTEIVDVWECEDGCPVKLLDGQSGISNNGEGPIPRWDRDPNVYRDLGTEGMVNRYGDEGGASRYFTQLPFDGNVAEYEPFFYTAKASTDEREAGCEYLPERVINERASATALASPRAGAGRTGKRRNHHPTVKSIELMRWLVRLITPPGGVVLDLFAGSGSTGVACSAERCRFIGIELSPEYAEIARARIMGDAPLLNRLGGL